MLEIGRCLFETSFCTVVSELKGKVLHRRAW